MAGFCDDGDEPSDTITGNSWSAKMLCVHEILYTMALVTEWLKNVSFRFSLRISSFNFEHRLLTLFTLLSVFFPRLQWLICFIVHAVIEGAKIYTQGVMLLCSQMLVSVLVRWSSHHLVVSFIHHPENAPGRDCRVLTRDIDFFFHIYTENISLVQCNTQLLTDLLYHFPYAFFRRRIFSFYLWILSDIW